MSEPSSPAVLGTLQRWMLSVISHPEGASAGIDSEAAQRQIGVAAQEVDKVIASSQQLTSSQRLQIYANAYYARLIDCLREEFPALVCLLGESTFDAFASGYLQRFEPHSYTLADLGRRFPQYLDQTRPPDTKQDDGRPSWPDLLIDLATVERTYSEVFDGPGIEGQKTLQADDLLAISPEEWPHARLVPVACLRLLALKHPVHEYISAARQEAEAVIPTPAPTYLAITRRDYIVRRSAVSAAEYQLLSGLIAGQTIGEAIETVASRVHDDWEALARNLRSWFHSWAKAAFFQAID